MYLALTNQCDGPAGGGRCGALWNWAAGPALWTGIISGVIQDFGDKHLT